MKQFGIAMGFLLSAIFAAPALAQTPQLVTEEMMVKTGDPGIEIYVRNKRPANMTSFRPEQTVLYPGHNYADRPTSTIGNEKRRNLCMRFDSLEEFLGFVGR